MSRPSRYAPEVRERAVRMVREHGAEHPSQWAAIGSIAGKLACTAETRRKWVRQAERDTGERGGLMTEERQRQTASGTTAPQVVTRRRPT
jgi:transposase